MKKTKKILFLGLMLFVAILILPYTVNAATTIDSSSTPEYHETENLFEAKGTTITISASETTEGNITITWDGGSQEIASSNAETLIVVGGYWNPATEAETTISLESTTVNMTGGTVGYLVGGNLIGKDYTNYTKIYVGTINVNITGGTLKDVSAVSAAIDSKVLANCNTALGSSYYENIETFYYADKVVMNIESATISNRVYILSSYTYAADVEVNVDNATVGSGYYSLAVGTNGKVGTYVVNIKDSTVEIIHAGFRAMVDSWTVNVTGNSTIGDIYAGSYYGSGERASDTTNWKGWLIGSVDYGQVGEMTFNLGENVTYNNIYAGFQFVDKELFAETYGTKNESGKYVLATYAAGIDGSETASVTINTYNAPEVALSKCTLKSMIDPSLENVTINYLTTTVSTEDVEEEVAVGDTTVELDAEELAAAFDEDTISELIESNEEIIELVSEGYNLTSTTVEVTEAETTDEIDAEVSSLGATVVNYLDISVYVVMTNSTGDEEKVAITETSSELTFNVSVTNDVADGYTRTYYVLYEHDGSVEQLDCTLSDDETYVTFTTDKFSTYVLAYVDTEISVSGITVSNSTTSSNSIKVWDIITLTATVEPTDAKNTSVTWSTSDSSVATVTEEGVVEGVKAGTATITATAADGSGVVGTYEVTVTTNYLDVTSQDLWYYDAVKDMYQQNIMTGIGDGTYFAPNRSLTRGMIVTILYRMEGCPEVSGNSVFSDVADSSKYYYDAVVWAAENGIVTGYGTTGMFKPNQSASRQELALILYRYAGEYKKLDVSTTGSLDSFPDASSVSSWAEEAVEWAVGEGIIQGVSSSGKMYIKPTSTVTRAQTATMISRFIANVE